MKNIWLLLLVISCTVLGGIGYKLFIEKRIAYIRTSELYENFALTKELDAQCSKVVDARKNILDSLMKEIQMVQFKINSEKKLDEEMRTRYELLKSEYLSKEETFKLENQTLKEKLITQIWNQLNQYTKDFGSRKGYTYILGATGEGSIMFAKENEDVTKELISYVNEKYKGN